MYLSEVDTPFEAFLNASEEIRFEGENREQVYGWVEQVLRQQQYEKQGRKARGLLRRYLEKMTGLSRAQVTRLIARYRAHGEVQASTYRRHRFPQRYTRADIELLATVDEAHETLSGPATRRILQREYQDYGKPEYQRLASISVAHLYNLRHQQRYRERRLNYTKTRPTAVSIGERRRPAAPQSRATDRTGASVRSDSAAARSLNGFPVTSFVAQPMQRAGE